MRNDYEKMITVRDYSQNLKAYNPAEENSMMSIEEYVKSVCQAQKQDIQTSPLITVQDYIKALHEQNTPDIDETKEMKANLKAFLTSKKAEDAAKILEKHCA